MSSKNPDLQDGLPGMLHHLPVSRSAHRKRHDQSSTAIQGHLREVIDGQREQNRQLLDSHKALHEKVDRLTNGIHRLVEEMHGVRTGTRTEAFARVGGTDCSTDLPTVKPDPALIYPYTASEISEALGTFNASEIGLLLGPRGLKWADNPDYQEITRRKRASQQRFWVYDIQQKIVAELSRNEPGAQGITDKAVLAIFRKWQNTQRAATAHRLGQDDE